MNYLDYVVDKVLKVIRRDLTKKTTGYDAIGTVRRIDGNTAWVHFDNGVDETPVKKSINCKKGDKVRVRISNGTAFIVGNETAPPTDDTKANKAQVTADDAWKEAEQAHGLAQDASDTAERTAQYFWSVDGTGDEAGAHITEVPQEAFEANPTGGNILLRSNSVKLRMALVTLMELTDTKLTFYDANGEKRAEFGTNGLYLYGKKVTSQYSFIRLLSSGAEFCFDNTGTVTSSAKLGNRGFDAFMFARYTLSSANHIFRSVILDEDGFRITHDNRETPYQSGTGFNVETTYLKDGEARIATADNTGAINSYTDIKSPRLDGDHIFRAHSVNNTDIIDVTYDGTNDKAVLSWNELAPFTTYTVTGTNTVNANSGETISCTTGTLPTGYTAIGIVGVSTNNELVTSIDRFVLVTGGASVTVRNHSSTNRSMKVTVTILCTALA